MEGLPIVGRVGRAMTHVMIDLETMGTSPTAAIVSIGAVCFDPVAGTVDEDDTFYRRVDLQNAVRHGGTMDASTVLWWLGQPEDARMEIVQGGMLLPGALRDLTSWYTVHRPEAVWSHGKEFDLTILEGAMQRLGVICPWTRGEKMDTRTVFALAGIWYKGTQHHALKDVIGQTVAVCIAYEKLGLRG